jgi:hypothetical protein
MDRGSTVFPVGRIIRGISSKVNDVEWGNLHWEMVVFIMAIGERIVDMDMEFIRRMERFIVVIGWRDRDVAMAQ